jgi:hypothetical protein
MSLSAKQEAFCRFYCANGGNATAAAKAAGYSEKTAHAIGGQNLKKVEIAEFIATLKKPVYDELEADTVWVRQKLKEEAERMRGGTHAGRIRALELIGKDLGMWKDEGAKPAADLPVLRMEVHDKRTQSNRAAAADDQTAEPL